jgi:hypothetical protein
MSLLGIMKLLGHRDQRMTLRYTQIADDTVGPRVLRSPEPDR